MAYKNVITTEEELRNIFGFPGDRAVGKEIDYIDEHCRTIIQNSPFMILSTSSVDGKCDASPKGDFPGFVRVLDDKTLAVPDLPGNNRLDTLCNMIENPNVGLIFLIPGMNETLRVNGRVSLVQDPSLLSDLAFKGKPPKLAIVVEVEQVYTHCAKAFVRSHLWENDTWIDRDGLPSFAQMLKDHIGMDQCDVVEFQNTINENLSGNLH